MMENIEKLLDEEIVKEVKGLEDIELGTEQYNLAVSGLTKLYDKSLEFKKLEIEKKLKGRQIDTETNIEIFKIENENKDRKTRNWLTGIGITAPLIVGSLWSWKSLKFEETGTVGSTVGRNMLNGLTKLKFWK